MINKIVVSVIISCMMMPSVGVMAYESMLDENEEAIETEESTYEYENDEIESDPTEEAIPSEDGESDKSISEENVTDNTNEVIEDNDCEKDNNDSAEKVAEEEFASDNSGSNTSSAFSKAEVKKYDDPDITNDSNQNQKYFVFGSYMLEDSYDGEMMPLKWRVLYDDGSCYTLILDEVVFAKSFFCGDDYIASWDKSEARSFLNGAFYNDAFSDLMKQDIVETSNSFKGYENGSFYSSSCVDKVYILSDDEYRNSDYGFPDSGGESDIRSTHYYPNSGVRYSMTNSIAGVKWIDTNNITCWVWTRNVENQFQGYPMPWFVNAYGAIQSGGYTGPRYKLGLDPVIRVLKNSKYLLSPEQQKITLSTNETKIAVGKKKTLSATGMSDIAFKSSDTAVATVSSSGVVTAKKPGAAIITAYSMSNESVYDTCKITVKYKLTYKLNGGTNSSDNPTWYTGKITLKNPKSRTSYTFQGWYTDSKFKTKVTSVKNANKTLYAKWVDSRKSVSKATITVGNPMYNGKARKPSVTVKIDSKTLKQGTDYTVSYSNNVNAGSKAVVKISGIGNYKGTVTKYFTIKKCSMGKDYITAKVAKSSYEYTGSAIKPSITVYFNGNTKLVKDTDYTVSYLSNKDIGRGYVVVTGKGNFESKGRLFGFDIVKASQPIKTSVASVCYHYADIGTKKTISLSGVKDNASVTVTSSNEKVAKISGSGGKYSLSIKGVGETTIKFKAKATKHYLATTKKITITVVDVRQEPTITLPQKEYILIKDTNGFNLGASTNSDGRITYKSSDENIVKVDAKGNITVVGNEGKATVSILVKETTKFKEKKETVSIVYRVYNTGDDYPQEYKNMSLDQQHDKWQFLVRECTSFVAWCLNSRNGVDFSWSYGGVHWDGAYNWGYAAQSIGITVDDTPAVGAVAWLSGGHVAWVKEVRDNEVVVDEYNYDDDGLYHESTHPTGYYQYIHIKDIG